jgi:hypothetical protein
MLLQGEPYFEFKEIWDDDTRAVPLQEAIRLINSQTEIVEEALNQPTLRTSTGRRQCVAYMLEQCILLSSVMISGTPAERRRFRGIRRALERARRAARGDGL